MDPAVSAEFGIAASPVPETAQQIGAWSAEARCVADRATIIEVLTKRAEPFAEDLFFDLIGACGLIARIEPEERPITPDRGEEGEPEAHSPLIHPDHGPGPNCPRGPALGLAVLNLRRDGKLVPECVADPTCSAQVWLRPDGTFQLEYRDRSPAEHFQTRTVSSEKIVAALTAWTVGEISWRESFQWMPIGS